MGLNFVNILSNTLVVATPLILAALGGAFSVRGGILALGLEGMMMSGAFCAVVASYYTSNAYIGLLFGMFGGMLVGFFHGVLSIKYKVNQVISGIGLNLFVLAGTTLFLQKIWGSRGNSEFVQKLDRVEIGFLNEIPIIGELFANQSLIFYIMIVSVVVSWLVIYKSVFGLRLRMVGENPVAAETLGVNITKYKYSAVLICGGLAGIGGSYLSIDFLSAFTREITNGRGFIAVVINILGAFDPFKIFVSGLFFGVADAIAVNMQGFNVPTQFIQMFPYVATIIVLAVAGKKIYFPKGIGA